MHSPPKTSATTNSKNLRCVGTRWPGVPVIMLMMMVARRAAMLIVASPSVCAGWLVIRNVIQQLTQRRRIALVRG